MRLLFYATLDKTGRLKIPVEFIDQFRDRGNAFTLRHDAASGAVVMSPCMICGVEEECCQTEGCGACAEDDGASDGWNNRCVWMRFDMMAYLTLPRNMREPMLWDEDTALAVYCGEQAITVKASGDSPDGSARTNRRDIYTPPKPEKDRFIEVYCQKAAGVWLGEAEPQGDMSEKIERVIVDTLVTATKDNRASIHVEYIGRFCYTARISNALETVTCLIKLGESYPEQAANIYQTLLHTSVI